MDCQTAAMDHVDSRRRAHAQNSKDALVQNPPDIFGLQWIKSRAETNQGSRISRRRAAKAAVIQLHSQSSQLKAAESAAAQPKQPRFNYAASSP